MLRSLPLCHNIEMASVIKRLATFRDMVTSSTLSASVVSNAGFYYMGVGYHVTCYSCGLHLNQLNFESGEHPMAVHRRLAPQCQFVSQQLNTTEDLYTNSTPIDQSTRESAMLQSTESAENTNAVLSHGRQHHNSTSTYITGLNRAGSSPPVPSVDRFPSRQMRERIDNNDPSLMEEMKYENQRLSSYANWPHDMNIAPEALAQAGLFYLCRADRVKCAFCRGILRNWEPSEDPMRKHRQLFPRCPFVRNPRAAGNVAIEEDPLEGVASHAGYAELAIVLTPQVSIMVLQHRVVMAISGWVRQNS